MRFFPVFLDLTAGRVVLAGGGEAALTKLRLLRAAGATVRWYVGDPADALEAGADDRIAVVPAGDAPADLADAVAVIAARGTGWEAGTAAPARGGNIPGQVGG